MFGDALRQDETGSAPQITRAKADVNQCSRWRWHRIGGYGSNKGRVQGTAYVAARMKRDHPSYAADFAAGKHSSKRVKPQSPSRHCSIIRLGRPGQKAVFATVGGFVGQPRYQNLID